MTIKNAIAIINAASNDVANVNTLAAAKTTALDALRAVANIPAHIAGYAIGAAVQDTADDVAAVQGTTSGVVYYLNRLLDKMTYIATF